MFNWWNTKRSSPQIPTLKITSSKNLLILVAVFHICGCMHYCRIRWRIILWNYEKERGVVVQQSENWFKPKDRVHIEEQLIVMKSLPSQWKSISNVVYNIGLISDIYSSIVMINVKGSEDVFKIGRRKHTEKSDLAKNVWIRVNSMARPDYIIDLNSSKINRLYVPVVFVGPPYIYHTVGLSLRMFMRLYVVYKAEHNMWTIQGTKKILLFGWSSWCFAKLISFLLAFLSSISVL